MANAVSFGFMRPRAEAVEVNDFKIIVDGEEFNAESTDLPSWDYASRVQVTATIQVDLQQFTQESGFIPGTAKEDLPQFVALINWNSNKTKQRGSSERQLLTDGTNRLYLEIDNLLLGGELQASVHIDLLKAGVPNRETITATRPGSRMWESESLRLRLEGDAAQMPITPLDFKKFGMLPTKAMWKIELSDEILLPVQAGMRVFINTSHPLSLRMLEKGSGKEKAMWEAYMQVEIIQRLLLQASKLDEIEQLENNPLFPGSLAESILNLAQALFPGKSYSDITADEISLFATAQAFVFKDMK